MPEGDYVEPLNGEEIVIDLCSRIAEKLRKDCNLRDSDSYQGGYSAKVTIHLEAYGMDKAEVNTGIIAGQERVHPDFEFDDTLEVPVEEALDMVRERSDQPVPTLTIDSGGHPLVRPRRYIRQDRVIGGATGETLP